MRAKPKSKPTHTVLSITRLSGAFLYAIPYNARVTAYAGRLRANALSRGDVFTGELPHGCQLRVYLGNKLIAFLPDVLEFHYHSEIFVKGDPTQILPSPAEQEELAKAKERERPF